MHAYEYVNYLYPNFTAGSVTLSLFMGNLVIEINKAIIIESAPLCLNIP